MVRAEGIEPSHQAWEARILPLNYARGGARGEAQQCIDRRQLRFRSGQRRYFVSCPDRLNPADNIYRDDRCFQNAQGSLPLARTGNLAWVTSVSFRPTAAEVFFRAPGPAPPHVGRCTGVPRGVRTVFFNAVFALRGGPQIPLLHARSYFSFPSAADRLGLQICVCMSVL